MRCTCFLGLADVSTARHDQATTPEACPVHGQRTARDTTTGALGGAPVVDLDLTLRGLLTHAEQVRTDRARLLDAAAEAAQSMARQADYLESLAATLGGATTTRSRT